MSINVKRPNGTEDVLPKDVNKWHTVEKIARETAESFGSLKSEYLLLKILNFFSVL